MIPPKRGFFLSFQAPYFPYLMEKWNMYLSIALDFRQQSLFFKNWSVSGSFWAKSCSHLSSDSLWLLFWGLPLSSQKPVLFIFSLTWCDSEKGHLKWRNRVTGDTEHKATRTALSFHAGLVPRLIEVWLFRWLRMWMYHKKSFMVHSFDDPNVRSGWLSQSLWEKKGKMKKSSCSSSSGAGFKFNFHRKKQSVPVTRALTTNSSLAPFYSVLFFRAP